MRTLAEIRQNNRRSDLLVSGMEKKSVEMPSDIYKSEKAYYDTCVKPSVRRLFSKQVSKGNF